MAMFQVFRSSDDFFVTPYPAAFVLSEDEDGNVFTPAEVVKAKDERQALAEAGER